MKKLSKISLLGEMNLLSKAELQKLVGSEPFTDSRCIGLTKDQCSGTCYISPEGAEGQCYWRGMSGQEFCRCISTYCSE